MDLDFYCCIAYPCRKPRVQKKGKDASAFCTKHKAEHAKSAKSGWVFNFRKLVG